VSNKIINMFAEARKGGGSLNTKAALQQRSGIELLMTEYTNYACTMLVFSISKMLFVGTT